MREDTAAEHRRGSANLHTEWTRGQRLLALAAGTGLAITQPLLALFGDTPELFIFNRIEGGTLVWIALAVAFLPPLVLWVIDLLTAAVNAGAGVVLHLALIWLLLLVAGIQLVKFQVDVTSPPVVVAVAASVATVVTCVYVTSTTAAMVGRAMSVLPVMSVVVFLFVSDTGDLLGGAPPIEPVEPAAAAKPEGDTRIAGTPVVFLLLDELPTKSVLDENGGIDRGRFPHLAALADGATWYRHFTTNSTLTNRAVPTMLAGRDGTEDAPLWTHYPDTIFSLLAPTHDLLVFESFTRLCGYRTCTDPSPTHLPSTAAEPTGPPPQTPSSNLGRFVDEATNLFRARISLGTSEVAFDDFEEQVVSLDPAEEAADVETAIAPPEGLDPDDTTLPAMEGREDDFFFPRSLENTTGLPVRFAQFLTALQPGGRPGLYFLHLVLPHQPWRYFDDGRLYNTDELDPDFPVSRTNEAGEWVAALTEQRHLYQASYTDLLVGAMVEQLRQADLYDDALVIVAADHGISFELDTPIRETSARTLDSLAYAPLIVKYPGQHDGLVDDSNVMAVDLLPTIAEVVGFDVPESVTGEAIGSEAQTGRGGAKYVLDVADDFGQEVRGTIEFDDSEAFPDPTDRWIRPTAGRDALAELAGMADLLGEPLDSIDLVDGGNVTIDGLDRHERPGEAPEALVVGRTGMATEGTIIIAVDGLIVAGSPLYELNGSPGSFAAMLPQELISDEKNLRVALLDGDGAIELTVVR